MSENPPPPTPENPYYRVGSIAKMLDVNPTQVRDWVTSKRLKGYKIAGQWRILKSDLIEFVNKEYGDG